MRKTLFAILGASGDLTYRKLLPALYNLFTKERDDFEVLAIARRDYDSLTYAESAVEGIQKFTTCGFSEETYESFKKHLHYYKMDILDANMYPPLKKHMDARYRGYKIIYYYAVSPEVFMPITLGISSIDTKAGETKVIIEKPFGNDLAHATKLYNCLTDSFGEENIYHIDHYLGKEMIQNISAVRFWNIFFKDLWNANYIDHIQISAFEKVGVETRGNYYDKSGALKDMVQNHLLQVLSIVAMEETMDVSANAIRQKQADVFKSLAKINPVDIDKILVMGQYQGYRNEANVNPHSVTETYVAMKVMIDNKRWKGVPFYIRTGKALKARETKIVVNFKSVHKNIPPDVLTIKIQPEEGISLAFNIKQPGINFKHQKVAMDFCQSCMVNSQSNTPEAYERLINAAFNSDRSLFSQWDQIVTSWKYTDTIYNAYKKYSNKLYSYPIGSCGPAEAKDLLPGKDYNWVDTL